MILQEQFNDYFKVIFCNGNNCYQNNDTTVAGKRLLQGNSAVTVILVIKIMIVQERFNDYFEVIFCNSNNCFQNNDSAVAEK